MLHLHLFLHQIIQKKKILYINFTKELVCIKNNNKKTKRITHMGDMIIYTYTRDGQKDYLTYNDELYKILTGINLIPFRDDGRLRFRWRNNGADERFYLYDIALACYKGFVHFDTFLADMRAYIDYKNNNGFDTDHADNNVHNNTKYNLSLMHGSLNRSKSEIVTQFKSPYQMVVACDEDEYRIQLSFTTPRNILQEIMIRHRSPVAGWCVGSAIAFMNFICKTDEDCVDCLKQLMNTRYEWCKPDKTPKEHWRKSKNVKCISNYVTKSITAQKKLLSMDREKFQIWGEKA